MHIIQQKILSLAGRENLGKLTLREIGKKVEIDHPQKIKHHLSQLIKKNLIRLDRSNESIIPIKSGSTLEGNLISIPILGSANCGEATLLAEEKREGMLNISKTLLNGLNIKSLFAVKAVGNSLNNANIVGENISDGDYVLIDGEKRSPNNNEYVLSIINGSANIKRFIFDKSKKQVILVSDSSEEFPPIYIHEDDMNDYMVNGTVVKIIKKPSVS